MANDTVQPGRFYTMTPGALPVERAPDPEPRVWICRRVEDYPGRKVPPGGAVCACELCTAPIVFNPARKFTNNPPRHCMQCEDIEPLPL